MSLITMMFVSLSPLSLQLFLSLLPRLPLSSSSLSNLSLYSLLSPSDDPGGSGVGAQHPAAAGAGR